MKGYIHYIPGHEASMKQADDCIRSFQKYNWDVELREGITPKTLEDRDCKLVDGGRLYDMKRKKEEKRFLTKLSCVSNHLRIWREAVATNQDLVFIEHDAICINEFNQSIQNVLILNIEYAFHSPSVLANYDFMKKYMPEASITQKPLPNDYPLRYYKDSIFKGHFMMPGTAAYAVSPRAAKDLLDAVEKYGLDQSDFLINTHNVQIDYIRPSPVRFNRKNLNTSHGI